MNRMQAFRALACVAALAAWTSATRSEEPRHWSYKGDTGPDHWGQLEPAFSGCSGGRAQSPVDIRTDAVMKGPLPAIQFNYKPSPLNIVDNGHSIQVNYGPGSFITIGNHRYQLVQFHFHKPSEEAVDGKHAQMVVHLVHQDSEGHLAVVAVLLEPGRVNPAMAVVWNNLPPHGKEVAVEGITVDASDLLPSDRSYWNLPGSLTTPPCTEGVSWYVMKASVPVSSGQVERFAHLYPMNARPLQPLNGRTIQSSQ